MINYSKPINDIAIYIHYPFCESKCPYCDFNSHVEDSIDNTEYQNMYLSEIEYFANRLGRKNITSIFFGGGTPSLMPVPTLSAILETIKEKFIVKENIEITVEANPGSFEVAKFKDFKKAGVNRVSIGVQSFSDANLMFLGRKHNANNAIHAIKSASEIFDNFSFDLMHSLENQKIDDWLKELEFATSFNSKHLSIYQLTIEKGTKFFSDVKKGRIKVLDEEKQIEFFEKTKQYLEKKSYINYEVSNFSKPNFESLHNLNYWQGGQYLGLGAGAHSRICFNDSITQRSALVNYHKPEKWLHEVTSKGNAIQQSISLSKKEFLEEFIMTGLRLKEGIDIKNLELVFGDKISNIFNLKSLLKIADQGLITFNDKKVAIADSSKIITNIIIAKVIDCVTLP